MNLLELTYQRCKASRAARELLDLSVTEARALTITEQVRVDGLILRVQQIDAAIQARAALRTN
jgi:hypothetical protein